MFHDLLLLEVGLFNHKLVAYFLFQVSVYLNIFITNIVKIKTPNIILFLLCQGFKYSQLKCLSCLLSLNLASSSICIMLI